MVRTCRHLSVLALLMLVASCDAHQALAPDLQGAAAAMLGSWQYVSPRRPSDPPVLGVGVLVALTIDAAEDSSFRGSVDSWIVGDVGLRPDTFGPVTGTIGSRGQVTVVISYREDGRPPVELTGAVVTDTFTVERSACGSEPGPFVSGSKFVRLTDQH